MYQLGTVGSGVSLVGGRQVTETVTVIPGLVGSAAAGLAAMPVAPPAPGERKRVLPPGYRCKKCDKEGHFIDECPNYDASKPRPVPPGYICKICNGTDHWITDCPAKPLPPAEYICHGCHQGGHWKTDCPALRAQQVMGGPGGRGGVGRGGGRGGHFNNPFVTNFGFQARGRGRAPGSFRGGHVGGPRGPAPPFM